MKLRSTTVYMTAMAAIAMLTASTAQADIFANDGFETAGAGSLALNWGEGGTDGYTRTTSDAFTGSASVLLGPTSVSGSAVLLQNSVNDGGLPPLVEGSNPLLSFRAKGAAGTTGVALYALRYLSPGGTILADSTLQNFGGAISPFAWSEITFDLGPVPVGASAAFIEIVLQGGGIPNGQVLIDDVKLATAVVPEPTSAALLGLSGVAMFLRRRRRS